MMQVKTLSTTKTSWKNLEEVAGGHKRKQDPGDDYILGGESHHQVFSMRTSTTGALCALETHRTGPCYGRVRSFLQSPIYSTLTTQLLYTGQTLCQQPMTCQ